MCQNLTHVGHFIKVQCFVHICIIILYAHKILVYNICIQSNTVLTKSDFSWNVVIINEDINQEIKPNCNLHCGTFNFLIQVTFPIETVCSNSLLHAHLRCIVKRCIQMMPLNIAHSKENYIIKFMLGVSLHNVVLLLRCSWRNYMIPIT